MSDGVVIEGKRIIYGQTRPFLPAFFQDGEFRWIMWGERREGDFFPHGGWVHPTELKGRAWRPWRAKEVMIPADGFMVHRQGGIEEWFPLGNDEGIRGLVACSEDDCRVYLITIQPPQEFGWARRWPVVAKLLEGAKQASTPVTRPRETRAHAKL